MIVGSDTPEGTISCLQARYLWSILNQKRYAVTTLNGGGIKLLR